MSNLKIYVLAILAFTFLIFNCGCVSGNEKSGKVSTLEDLENNKNSIKTFEYHNTFPFNNSDVIGFTFGNPNDYISYKVDFVTWGHAFQSQDSKWEYFSRRIQSAKTVGIRSSALIGTRTFWRGFIDYTKKDIKEFCCKKVDGTPVLLKKGEKNYKGHPPYWFCTNHPIFREYLKNITKIAMQFNPDGFMMDDPGGTAVAALWHDGCYCKYCISQFREYLGANFSQKELEEKGITDITHFDLRKYHKRYSDLPTKKRPLREEIIKFQFEASVEMYREIAGYAIEQRGKNILISGNIDPSNRYQGALFNGVDYFACECPMQASTGSLPTGRNLLAFKVGEALKRPVAIVGRGRDHAHVEKMKLPGMVRCWIAEAYAYGNYFMAPYNLWAYSKEKGPHHFRLPHHEELIAPLYHFIKRHRAYFDKYESLAKVAIVHSLETHQFGPDRMSPLINKLAELNLPFNIIISGGSVLDVSLHCGELKKYKSILLPPHADLNSKDLKTLEEYSRNGGVVVRKLKDLDMTTRIIIDQGNTVRASIRCIPNNPKKAVIIHLLNRKYDQNKDICIKKEKFKVKVPQCIFTNTNIHHIKYIGAPVLSSKNLAFNENRQQKSWKERMLNYEFSEKFVEIEIPELAEWGIVVLVTSGYVGKEYDYNKMRI